jgi:hypothetical protein
MKLSAILISGFVMINPRRSPAKVGFIWALRTAVKYSGLPSPLRQPTHESQVHEVGHAARRTGGKQPTPISERYDASVPLLGGRRLFYLHWELQRTQRKGWELPHTPPLTWNALAFERTGEYPQHGKQRSLGLGGTTNFFRVDLPTGAYFLIPSMVAPASSGRWTHGYVGALGNKRAFDPPLNICNPHAPRSIKHDGNMTRGRTVGAFPQTCRRSAIPSRRVELLGTASLGLTGPFQVPGHLIIYLCSLV